MNIGNNKDKYRLLILHSLRRSISRVLLSIAVILLFLVTINFFFFLFICVGLYYYGNYGNFTVIITGLWAEL